jgi:hypothetical protein
MRRHAHALVLLGAGLVFGAGAAVEVATRLEIGRARDVVAQDPAAREALRTEGWPGAARRAQDVARAAPDARSHALAAAALAADGDLDGAARHATFAARLAPDDAGLAARAEDALDAAILGRLRPAGRVLGLGAALAALLAGAHAALRRRRRARMGAYLAEVRGRIEVSIDGRRGPGAVLSPAAGSVRVNVFLRDRRLDVPTAPPSPGATLAVVLTHASRTVRLPPVRALRTDAASVRLGDDARRALLARPGPWRVQARLDGCVVATTTLPVVRGEAVAVA